MPGSLLIIWPYYNINAHYLYTFASVKTLYEHSSSSTWPQNIADDTHQILKFIKIGKTEAGAT